MRYRDLVEDLLEIQNEPVLAGWLAVVDEIHTVTAEELKALSQHVPEELLHLTIIPLGLKFDEDLARWFFAATKTWRECRGISVQELRRIMPLGVVSRNAKRVAVWDPLLRAFSRNVVKVSRAESALLTSVTGSGVQQYLTLIDVEKRLFSCSCPAYNTDNENNFKRHILCKHLLLSIYHHHSAILEESNEDPKEWLRSLSAAKRHREHRVMLANWLYYFVKRVFAPMEFEASQFEDENQVREVLALMGGVR